MGMYEYKQCVEYVLEGCFQMSTVQLGLHYLGLLSYV